MNNIFAQFDFWLVAVGGLLIFRYFCLVLAAEQGRKRDLTRKLYKANLDFNFSLLIPYLDSSQCKSLMELNEALAKQDYPSTKVNIHLVVTEETAGDLFELRQQPNVHVWIYPVQDPIEGDAVWWLIERCKALGNSGMFVFLKPGDIVKQDFLQNIAARALESNVLQGYVAIKKRPETFLGRVVSLSERLSNRIDNAGRYHVGLSPQLMDTGWAVKQEVLEMIPYRRGWDVNNLEYTLALNLQDFRVTWAPNVVVYSDEQTDVDAVATHFLASTVNRLQLFFLYSARLLFHAVKKQNFGYFEHLLSLIKPPHFLVGLFLVVMTILAHQSPNTTLGGEASWAVLAGGYFLTQMMAMFVARCRMYDYGTFFLCTPLVYMSGLIALPLATFRYAKGLFKRMEGQRERLGYRRIKKTRFNEEIEPYPTELSEEMDRVATLEEEPIPAPWPSPAAPAQKAAPSSNVAPAPAAVPKPTKPDFDQIYNILSERLHAHGAAVQELESASPPLPAPEPTVSETPSRPAPQQRQASSIAGGRGPKLGAQRPAARRLQPPPPSTTRGAEAHTSEGGKQREFSKTVAVSNGEKEVNCTLKKVTRLSDAGEELTQMSLVYKTFAFSTSFYRLPDQAYYELYSKLRSRGFTLMTCGSCGYFYKPPGEFDSSASHGLCLFGKMGKELDLKTDAVTTLSTACLYHTDIEQRETIVREWRNSQPAETSSL